MRLFYFHIIFLFTFSANVFAQQSFQINELPTESTVLTGWKMFVGDNPEFANPAFDDSKWKPVDLRKDIQQFTEFRKAGVIWARLHLSIDRKVANQQLSAYVVQYSASEIYLNGKLIKKYGTIGDVPNKTTAYLPSPLPFDFRLVPQADNVLAVRLAYQNSIPYISYMDEDLPTLAIYVNNKKNALEKYHASERETKMYVIIYSISSGMLLIIGFIYFVYFLFDRKQILHLYYALAMLAQSLNALPVEVWGADRYGVIERLMWVFFFETAAYATSMLFILLTIYTIFNYPHRFMLKFLTVASVVLVSSLYLYGTAAFFTISYVYPAAPLFAGAYACIWAIRQRKKHAGVILVGVLVYAFAMLSSAIIPVNSVSAQLLFYMAQMCFPIGMSFYLGIQSAVTNKNLRSSLAEVQTLSEKNLAQEQEKQQLLSDQNDLLERQVLVRTNELHQSLIELKATQSQLIQSEKMASLGELTAGIAHEIQNPLNFVNNFSDVSIELLDEMETEIGKGDLDEARAISSDIKQNLEKINLHGKRADAIVKGMLEHSRTSTGKKELTDLNALCDEYLRLSYHGLRAKDKSFNATMKTDFDQNLEKINIIPQDIGRVVLNLLTNAFYAVNDKKQSAIENYDPTVSISTKKVGDKVEIRVIDNGNGMPQKIVDKIFQPFFTTKPTGKGTGLGLSLSYDIVKQGHGGELTVETEEGQGTQFIICLPI